MSTWQTNMWLGAIMGTLLAIFTMIWSTSTAVMVITKTAFSATRWEKQLLFAQDHANILTIDLETVEQTISLSILDERCIQIEALNQQCNRNIIHKIDIHANHWYGGPQFFNQRWPIESQDVEYQQYRSNDLIGTPKLLGSITERYWLASNGLGLIIQNDDEDLYYSINNKYISLGSNTKLNYTLCKSRNLLETHLYISKQFVKKPLAMPDTRMFVEPIWSTWAKYKTNISQTVIEAFASEIRQYNFSASQLEIDDIYTVNYGDMIFDPKRFPDPASMLCRLHKADFRVTSWMHPFVNVNTEAFQVGIEQNYFVTDSKGIASLIRWWQGVGCLIDMYNEEARKWYIDRLNAMQSSGVDSYKFDAGESCYSPTDTKHNKNLMTQIYVQIVTQFGGQVEVRAVYRNQDAPIFVRMMDKSSNWGFENGLKTMIPSALHQSIHGYPFILPDMIGGNAYGEGESINHGALPEKELYIRWFQLTAFLPSMQISISPWQYDDETIMIAQRLVKFHEKYVAPKVIRLAQESIGTGYPIIRPLWWIAPDDRSTYSIEDQFLVGDIVLVAPVLQRQAIERQIYLPKGTWKDMNTEKNYVGPVWIKQYPVTIETIPFFEKTKIN